MKQFLAGICIGLVAAGGVGAWLVHKAGTSPIMFPSKSAFDGGNIYHFEGSLYGTGRDAPVNGFMSAWCSQGEGTCEITTIDQIGNNFIGAPYTEKIAVRKWTNHEILADSKGMDPRQCYWYEIRIDRPTEEISYTRTPNKEPNAEVCKNYTMRAIRWHIDDGFAHPFNHDGSSR